MNTNTNGNAAIADATRYQGMNSGPLQNASAYSSIGNTTTTTFPQVSGNLGGGTLNTNWNGYAYQYWPTYYDYSVPNRVAQLEGEVKVLREMVAALLSGKAQKAPAKR